MALLHILKFPDPRLQQVAQAVTTVDESVRQLVRDMIETMYEAEGVGLAATQVDVHRRVVVMDTSETRDQVKVLINPEVVAHSDDWVLGEEGCLSVPQIYDKVERHSRVRVQALDLTGQVQVWDAEGLEAVCIQHEIDHLNGRVFVDHLSALKRDRIRTKLIKQQRQHKL